MKAKIISTMCGGEFIQIKKENQEFAWIFIAEAKNYEFSEEDQHTISQTLDEIRSRSKAFI